MAPTTMTVTNTPAADLALTNLAHCSPLDLQTFAIPGTKLNLALIGDSFGFYRDSISVSRFTPPADFNLTMLTLELEFVKKGIRMNRYFILVEWGPKIDAVALSSQLKERFINQVMTAGQRVSFEHKGTNYIFTVNQAVGPEESTSTERGMISSETYFVFEAPSANGIKIVNQRDDVNSKIFKHKEFNLQTLGIGGLGAEFADIFEELLPPVCSLLMLQIN
ncbi:hypothetical protein M0R45_002575 [Rubus argutus]|uniref:Vesicle-fusing ATPase n=1 Tax=Rubus argutus TaxID=59490 RepID=A0AAW1VR74_RUBAR